MASQSFRTRLRKFQRYASHGYGVLCVLRLACAQRPLPAGPGLQVINITEELNALSGIDPGQLAAQTAINARFASQQSAALLNSSALSREVAFDPVLLQGLARVLGPGYGFSSLPPGPDLAGSIGRPTATAAYGLGTPAGIYGLPVLPNQGTDGSGPGVALSAAQTTGRSNALNPMAASGTSQPAYRMGRRLRMQSPTPLPTEGFAPSVTLRSAAEAPQVLRVVALPPRAIATAPGVYGLVAPSGALKAYRLPGTTPPSRTLNT